MMTPRCKTCLAFSALEGNCHRESPKAAIRSDGTVISFFAPTREGDGCLEHTDFSQNPSVVALAAAIHATTTN